MVNDPSFKSIKGLLTFIFNKADKSRDRFELFIEEALRSLKETGIKFVLKAKQKRAIENFFKTKLKIQGRINKLQALKETPLLVYCFLKKLFCLKVFFLI